MLFIYAFILCLISTVVSLSFSSQNNDAHLTYNNMPEAFPGTKPLIWEGDLSVKMMDGAHRFIERKIDESINKRSAFWNRNLNSYKEYEISVEPNRRRFMNYIGVEDKNISSVNYNVGLGYKHPQVLMQRFAINDDPELVAETTTYRVYQVRWPVLNRVYGEGLLLVPKTTHTIGHEQYDRDEHRAGDPKRNEDGIIDETPIRSDWRPPPRTGEMKNDSSYSHQNQ